MRGTGHVGKDDLDVDTGEHGSMFEYVSDETEDAMPLTHSMSTRLARKLNDVRKNIALWWSRPEQSLDIAGVVHVGEDDQEIMFGYNRHSCTEEVSTAWCHSRFLGQLEMELCISCMSCFASALMRHSDAVREV